MLGISRQLDGGDHDQEQVLNEEVFVFVFGSLLPLGYGTKLKVSHQEMGMFGNHKFELISIFFFLKQFFFICCMRDLRSNFAYKPNETPVIQRKKKKKEKEIKSRINYLYQSMMLHWTINTNKLKNKLIV
jgi:hypothetical protein